MSNLTTGILGTEYAELSRFVLGRGRPSESESVACDSVVFGAASFGPIFFTDDALGFTVRVNGSPISFKVNTLKITEQVNGRNTASFSVANQSSANRPTVGSPITISYNGSTKFAGTIDKAEEVFYPGTTSLEYSISAVDKNALADRRLVIASYEGVPVETIVAELASFYLLPEGVSVSSIVAGPVIQRITFPYVTVAEAFDTLCDITGYVWSINYAGELYFGPPTATASGLVFSDAAKNVSVASLSVTRDRSQYRNTQLIVAGTDVTDPQTDTFKGDGTGRTWTLRFKLEKLTSVKVNGVDRTFGVKGLDNAAEFTWNKDDATVSQSTTASVLTSSDTIVFGYTGRYPVLIQRTDPAEIRRRKAIEGGTGKYEQVERDESLNSASLGVEKAKGLLRRHGFIPTKIRLVTNVIIESDCVTLNAGQIVGVQFPIHGVDDTFLIQSLSISDKDGEHLVYELDLIDGERAESWAEFIGKLIKMGRRTTLRETELLNIIRDLGPDEVSVTDADVTITTRVTPWYVGDDEVSYSEWT